MTILALANRGPVGDVGTVIEDCVSEDSAVIQQMVSPTAAQLLLCLAGAVWMRNCALCSSYTGTGNITGTPLSQPGPGKDEIGTCSLIRSNY